MSPDKLFMGRCTAAFAVYTRDRHYGIPHRPRVQRLGYDRYVFMKLNNRHFKITGDEKPIVYEEKKNK